MSSPIWGRIPVATLWGATVVALVFFAGALAPTAHAAVNITSLSAVPGSTKAGGHPDFSVWFTLSSHQVAPDACDCDDAKDTSVHLPAGFIGNPSAAPKCSLADFAADRCPVDAQIGVALAEVASNRGKEPPSAGFITPVFNLVPPPGEAGLLGFKSGALDSPTFEVVSARTDGDYGLDVTVKSIEHFFPLIGFRQIVWGVPAAPVHDNFRFGQGEPARLIITLSGPPPPIFCDANGVPSTADPSTVSRLCPEVGNGGPAIGELPPNGPEGGGPGYPVSSNSALTPFTQNPTTCGLSSLSTSLNVLSYDGSETRRETPWPSTTDCDQLSFNPSLFAQPTTEQTDAPSGLNIDLSAPSFESPSAPSPSEIRGTTVTLPPGFTINSAAADGKTSCADAEAKFGTTEEAKCPEFAKIGTLEVQSPVLPGVLPGAIYIGKPLPGNRYRLFLAFDGFGVHVKLAGTVHPDPVTGQVVSEFKNLPQFPFDDFNLHFFGAERGILATPVRCGSYPVTTEFEPWDSALPSQTSTQYFSLTSGPSGSPCSDGARPFQPGFQAAAAQNTAGAHTQFAVELTRRDGEQNFSGLEVTTPLGLTATLKGIPYCPDSAIREASAPGHSGLAELASPTCPSASQVGEAFAGAGVGAHPFYAPGKVYLAGRYRGAPLSLVVITPAVSGPYDLGNAVVRVALQVDPFTARVTAASDPLPQILEGVPLRLRSILVELNRPDFALNPTNCQSLASEATAVGSEGAAVTRNAPFQVANCARLPFEPRLHLRLKGSPKRAKFPALSATLTMPPGSADVATAQVTLPHSSFLAQSHIGKTCGRRELASHNCPAASIYGRAKAETPLLDKPLEGPVYLATGFGYNLPALVAELDGQIEVLLKGKVDSGREDGLRTTFELVPDAPVSRFSLHMFGGRRGLIQNSEYLCGAHAKRKALARFAGQNGKVRRFEVEVANSCGQRGGKRSRGRRTVR
jgi:hypothetical protein